MGTRAEDSRAFQQGIDWVKKYQLPNAFTGV